MSVKSQQIFVILGLLFFVSPLIAETPEASKPSLSPKTLVGAIGHRLSQIWHEGTPDLYLTGYAWHNRYTYTPEKLQSAHYNEFAAGGGWGKSIFDEDGDWQALYAMGFSDSHRNFQPLIGYAFQKMLHLKQDAQLGAGFTWFITERQDILHGIPFPGIPLPMVTLGVKRVNVFATYVPGGTNVGNVLFVFLKVAL